MKKGQSGIIIGLIVLIVLVGSVVLFCSDRQGPITGNVVSDGKIEEKNCEEVQVPYIEEEVFNEEICDGIELEYEVEKGACLPYEKFGAGEPARSSCKVRNLDPYVAGYFTLNIGFLVNGEEIVESQTYFVPQDGGYSRTFFTELEAPIDSCVCYVEKAPRKPGCEIVTKTRTVTRYNTETVCS